RHGRPRDLRRALRSALRRSAPYRARDRRDRIDRLLADHGGGGPRNRRPRAGAARPLLRVLWHKLGWRPAHAPGRGRGAAGGVAGRVVFGVLSVQLFGGRRRIVLVIAGIGSTVCSLIMAGTGPGTGVLVLAPLALCFGFFGIGWNGVQHTLMAELVGPRAAGTAIGLGLAISSFGVTICPPIFGLAAERLGGFAVPWAALGIIMAATLCLLIPVREGRMET